MSVELLDNTRRLEKLLQEYSAPRIEFSDICRLMSDILKSDVYVFGRRGRVLGCATVSEDPIIPDFDSVVIGSRLNPKVNQRLANVLSTSENTDPVLFGIDNPNHCHCLVSPVVLSGSRLGTLFVVVREGTLSIDDIIICEFGATVVGMEIFRSLKEEKAADLRSEQNVKMVVETLSHSEMSALRAILTKVRSGQQVVVGTAIADEIGVARASVVNALKKCVSAGILETKSGGRNGTLIRVLNDRIYDILNDKPKE
jgi:transcriptional pleiotropic repressor